MDLEWNSFTSSTYFYPFKDKKGIMHNSQHFIYIDINLQICQWKWFL